MNIFLKCMLSFCLLSSALFCGELKQLAALDSKMLDEFQDEIGALSDIKMGIFDLPNGSVLYYFCDSHDNRACGQAMKEFIKNNPIDVAFAECELVSSCHFDSQLTTFSKYCLGVKSYSNSVFATITMSKEKKFTLLPFEYPTVESAKEGYKTVGIGELELNNIALCDHMPCDEHHLLSKKVLKEYSKNTNRQTYARDEKMIDTLKNYALKLQLRRKKENIVAVAGGLHLLTQMDYLKTHLGTLRGDKLIDYKIFQYVQDLEFKQD